MTNYYTTRLIQAYDLYRMSGQSYKEIAEHFGYSKGVNDIIRGMFNRFVKIDADVSDVRDYLEGNYLVSIKALEYYIRFVGERNREISSRALAEELNIYNVECLTNMLRGLSATMHELVNYTDTNDLDVLTIR